GGRPAEKAGLPGESPAGGAAPPPARATQMLAPLAGRGGVERVRSDSARRVVLTRLTPDGRERFAAKQRQIEERWRDALGDIPAEDLGNAARVLRRMAEVLDAI